MDIALERKFLSTFKLICSAEHICDLSADIVVPDTKEDILRIIYTNAKYKIRSKDVESGKLIIRGELEVNSAYVPETVASIEFLRTDIPFECEFENDNIESGCASVCDIKLLNIESRILNPRKIMINAQLLVCGRCYRIDDFTWYEKPMLNESKVFFKNDSVDARLISVISEKTFSLEDDFEIGGMKDDAQIISADTEFFADSSDTVGSKLIVKGHAEISVLYVSGGKIERAEKRIGFSQIFELTERDVIPEFAVSVLPTGDFFEISEGRISFEIHAVMQIVCSDTREISYLSDAYACGAEMMLTDDVREICIDRQLEELREKVQLSYTSDSEILSIEIVSVKFGKTKISENEVSVPVYADIVYTSVDSQLWAGRVHSSVKFSTADSGVYDSMNIAVSEVRSIINGKEINVSADVIASASWCENKQIRMITEASIEKINASESMPSIYMCRAADNDLWSLAKRYKSDAAMISELNSLEEKTDITDRLLIIPRIK